MSHVYLKWPGWLLEHWLL